MILLTSLNLGCGLAGYLLLRHSCCPWHAHAVNVGSPKTWLLGTRLCAFEPSLLRLLAPGLHSFSASFGISHHQLCMKWQVACCCDLLRARTELRAAPPQLPTHMKNTAPRK